MRIGVLAGEASGDVLGARVLAALRLHCPELVVEGVGGPQMEAQGLRSMFPMERLSIMGFVEPMRRLPELLRIRRAVLEHFSADPPDLFLGIDSPDFNLALETRLRERGVSTAHLVSPSVWAWRRGRVRKIKRAADLMLCLFPFETAIYKQHGIPVRFVGHPLADEIALRPDRDAARRALGLSPHAKMLALLPGSRSAEVRLLTPVFLEVARRLRQTEPELMFTLPAASPERSAELASLLAEHRVPDVTLVDGRSREVLAASDAVLLASGTATLEAALLKRPMVVAYRMGTFSWLLLKRLVKTPYVALPNILAGRRLVPELLQRRAEPAALAAALAPLLGVGAAVDGQLREFDRIHGELRRGFAERTAEALLELVRDKNCT